mgnify:CR=1 FL=1
MYNETNHTVRTQNGSIGSNTIYMELYKLEWFSTTVNQGKIIDCFTNLGPNSFNLPSGIILLLENFSIIGQVKLTDIFR